MASGIKRTYGSRSSRSTLPSSPPSLLNSSPAPKRKRPLSDDSSLQNTPSPKKSREYNFTTAKSSKKAEPVKEAKKQHKWTQLHFSLDTTVLRTCPLCDLSYTQGAPDDESLHRTHCIRVRKGLEWGRDEEREIQKLGVEEVATAVKLKNGSKGRIICFRPNVGGKIGTKVRYHKNNEVRMMMLTRIIAFCSP